MDDRLRPNLIVTGYAIVAHMWKSYILSTFDHVQIVIAYSHIWGYVITFDVTSYILMLLLYDTEANLSEAILKKIVFAGSQVMTAL